MAGVIILKVLVDTGSALNVFFTNTLKYWHTYPFLRPYSNMVLKLNGALTMVRGSIKLAVESEVILRKVRLNAGFVVFDFASPYDSIMEKPLLLSLRVVIYMYHYSLKFPMLRGIGEIKENMELAEGC